MHSWTYSFLSFHISLYSYYVIFNVLTELIQSSPSELYPKHGGKLSENTRYDVSYASLTLQESNPNN